jgi:hypothetical protein
MLIKRFSAILAAALLVCSFSSQASAEFFSVSAGVPVSHSFSNENVESDGVGGFLFHVKLPIMIGIGMEAYDTKIKATEDTKLKTTMYDLFYLTPIPIINVTIGAGVGSVELDCEACSDLYEAGPATQLWGQLGFSILPALDIHLSYHNIQAKIKSKTVGIDDVGLDGAMTALGVSFIF